MWKVSKMRYFRHVIMWWSYLFFLNLCFGTAKPRNRQNPFRDYFPDTLYVSQRSLLFSQSDWFYAEMNHLSALILPSYYRLFKMIHFGLIKNTFGKQFLNMYKNNRTIRIKHLKWSPPKARLDWRLRFWLGGPSGSPETVAMACGTWRPEPTFWPPGCSPCIPEMK